MIDSSVDNLEMDVDLKPLGLPNALPDEEAAEVLSTGVAGLDEMLGGGIPLGSSVITCGSTGSGKTVLAQQMAYAAAAAGHNILYLTDLAGSGAKAVRGLLKFSFFDPGAYNIAVSYEDLTELAKRAQMQEIGARIIALAQQRDALLIVIDSIDLAIGFAENQQAVHRSMQSVCNFVSEKNLVGLLIAGCRQEELQTLPEAAIADGIVLLTAPYESSDSKGYMRVLKMRGVQHAVAAFEFRIGSSGLELTKNSDGGP